MARTSVVCRIALIAASTESDAQGTAQVGSRAHFLEEVQAHPQNEREVGAACPPAELREVAGRGHCSIYGHAYEQLNARIEEIVNRSP